MCSREELIKQLITEASVLTDEEVAEVLEYAKREFEATVETRNEEKKKVSPFNKEIPSLIKKLLDVLSII